MGRGDLFMIVFYLLIKTISNERKSVSTKALISWKRNPTDVQKEKNGAFAGSQ